MSATDRLARAVPTRRITRTIRIEPHPSPIESRRWRLSGQVQGVGFRPFVHRLAEQFGLHGWVRNLNGEVEVLAEGSPEHLDRFAISLLQDAPDLARPRVILDRTGTATGLRGFRILPSDRQAGAERHVPADTAPCVDCERERTTPANRRHRHPFIQCTQCGPRYTLLHDLPFDRVNTSLSGFSLCADCAEEYRTPADRRFHAEPLCCPQCGPQLAFEAGHKPVVRGTPAALAAAVAALQAGQIVAVKGIGGYHLLCDARHDQTVQRLRARKLRPDKPLAVMVPPDSATGLDWLHAVAMTTEAERVLLRSPARPIVLLRARRPSPLSAWIAPGLNEIGVMLPYSALHALLAEDVGAPLVVTSGNVGGEPVLTDVRESTRHLAAVADAFLHHDRPILRPVEDSVWRTLTGSPRPLRLGRGAAPIEIDLPWTLDVPLLAVGGHLKCTVALAWGSRCALSSHLGDLSSLRGVQGFEHAIADLQRLYRVNAERVIHDAHPDYASTRWARATGLPTYGVWHHHAHASALAGEHPDVGRWLVFAWDGNGYGEDQTLWGGEALLGRPGHWQRVASFRPFRLPGGERAAREPWRSALSLCWETGRDWPGAPTDTVLLRQAWEQRINVPLSSSVGRLFDAAAALTGVVHTTSYDGQAPMQLEALAGPAAGTIPLPLQRDAHGVWRSDWSPLLPMLLDTRHAGAERAAIFHDSLARTLVEQAQRLQDTEGPLTIGLTGGVFQNRRLTESACAMLRAAGFDVRLTQRLPCNDGGLSYGQVIDASAH